MLFKMEPLTKNSSTKGVVIRPGILSYVLSLAWLTFGISLLSVPLQLLLQPSNSQLSPADVLHAMLLLAAFLVAGSVFLWLAAMLIKQRYLISLEGVNVRRLRDSKFIRWDEVEVFGEQATFTIGSNYKVRLYNGETATFFTAVMAHPKLSAKALIEAAYSSGANIEFKFILGNEFGLPPYGIFKRK